MVRMQVAFTPVMSVAKLREHSIGRRVPKIEAAKVGAEIRLPSAIHTPPAVTLEA